ncbi:MAG: hypothetical protein J6N45_00435 [Alphaproteobacteria bacterium]|nr:hypothetical protein [Alphaproteobacteria bacterium]
MTDFTKELLFGMRPVRRTNPRPGESSWREDKNNRYSGCFYRKRRSFVNK